jgi:hypothetical protein
MDGSIGAIASDVAKVVFKASPLLASALGSPVAGMVLSLLGNAFGVAPPSLASAIAADPDAATKLKALEMQHAEALASIDDADAANARDMAIKHDNRMPMILALIFTAIYIAIQAAAIYHPSTSDDIISARVQDIMLIIIGFYFGNKHPRIASDRLSN